MVMKKLLKQLVCVGVILILSTVVVFATDEHDGGGAGGNSVQPVITTESAVK